MKTKKLLLLLPLLAALAACSRAPEGADDELARVGNASLTLADLRAVMPAALSPADSAAFAAAYVKSWVDEKLITEVAARQLRNLDEIDRLTAEYRRQLIMWEYRKLKVSTDSALAITDADVAEYYREHAADMKLEEPMLRGIYIKIANNAPALKQVKKWYRSDKQDDIDRLEKVGLKDAIHYDYFRDTWVPLSQVADKIPVELTGRDLKKGLTLEHSADGFTYLLSVSDVLPAGGTMPLEAATPRIRMTLDALRLQRLDARLLDDLRRDLNQASDSSAAGTPADR